MNERPTTLPIASEADLAGAVVYTKELARELGFSAPDQARCATAVSELARNVLKYAKRGQIVLRGLERAGRVGLEAVIEDQGPGIGDLEQAMQDHFSSSGTLGLGLGAVKRMMDELEIESSPRRGTRVRIAKWL